MVTQLTVGVGYLAFLVILGAVVGSVHRQERYLFASGVVLLLVGLAVLSGTVGAVVAFVGIAAVVAAAIPLLLE